MRNATYRIIKYDTHFDPPFPFILKSTNENINALSSDTITINIAGLGELPDSIYFHWIEDNIKNYIRAV